MRIKSSISAVKNRRIKRLKFWQILLWMLFVTGAMHAQNRLTIVVDGIEEIKGHLAVALYDEENFRKTPLMVKMEKVNSETIIVTFDDVLSGEYAVSIYHDENDNGKLDTGAFGIPQEKYGFSNNARGKMGPPTFLDCQIKIEEDTEINITVI